ncbi:MAG TPA: ABC transporter ATP-binding protein [Egibacteraceae bacterium]|nr:ABC transporter ATP-binding protein [Egibacteraceae bacterium]
MNPTPATAEGPVSQTAAQPASTTPAVELVGIVKRFDEVTAVDDVNLAIADGEFFSLLGPSGCGKTTTLRMIAGLEFPTEGSIRLHGHEMALRPPNKRPVNTVFQSYALFPHMSVAQNVAFGLQMQKVAKSELDDRVAESLKLVQLTGMEKRKPKQLSGGQQQRVALARALVNHPQVLLLDEPLGALDLKLRKAMQLELKELQQRVGITFVYVTHDQEEALTMSDRIGVMSEGKLLQVGTPEEIYEQPRTRMVADFIGETNFLPATHAGTGRVRLVNGEEIDAPIDGVAGQELTLTVRPEKMAVVATEVPPDPGVNAIEGIVHRRVYLGNALTYEVDVAGDVRLHVRHENAPGQQRFDTGDRVRVCWDPSATAVLEA